MVGIHVTEISIDRFALAGAAGTVELSNGAVVQARTKECPLFDPM
jgi:hypothetical protein